ncbi:uncharacterized protein EV420DRAFT_1646498 [Desarmillaria tabescens]|uniref:N-acetyltransferase domain-containing protein n=1 Tax=Armillaria tabescens TaxID=1929756 RepID=A0AA39JZY6_ARMTA|nr:uncharacterized protein EV420DRAFT_1646498 [Desarmillaria tabescens]KAK0450579.1 hypothetical protein EV420DRAFT_1646498 [Desarmillaria tabescens]
MSLVQTTPSATIRVATNEDREAAINVLTRAFLNDHAMNWWGCVKKQNAVIDIDSPIPGVQRTIRDLQRFQKCLVTVVMLIGGVITLAVVPQRDGGEKVVGVTSVLRGWGFRGLKRFVLDFVPPVEKALSKAFKARNLDRLDSWYLLEIVVDPDWQGKGVSSLLLKDCFSRANHKPIHLEASSSKSRDVYKHLGFEVDEECLFGKGQVDCHGVSAKGAEATGISEWIMTKWET